MKVLISCICFIITTAAHAHHNLDSDSSAVGMWLFDEGIGHFAYDRSGNQRHGKLINSPKWQKGKFGHCLQFMGNADTVVIQGFANEFPGEELTMMAWVKVQGHENRELFSIYPKDRGHVAVLMPWEDDLWGTGVRWLFGTPFFQIHTEFEIPVKDIWKHWAFVHSKRNRLMIIYQNAAALNWTNGIRPFAPRPGNFHIGGRPELSFQGLTDEVAIFERAFSQQEIHTIMTRGLATALAVEPTRKLASTWGEIKIRR